MTMTLDPNSQRFGSLNYGHMSSYPSSQPHFTNPWSSPASSGVGATSAAHPMYASSSQPGLNSNPLSLDALTKHQQHPAAPQPQQQQQQQQQQHTSRTSGGSPASMSSYGSVPATSASAGSPHSMAHVAALAGGPHDLLSSSQDLLSLARMAPAVSNVPASAGYGDAASYTSASPIHPTYTATSQAPYESIGRYAPGSMQPAFTLASDADHSARRYSQTSMPQDDRSRFADALEASQGMLSMSQETPRNIYGPQAGGGRSRGSADSYGFPATHSTSSSVSSSSGFGYYGGSIDSSVSDYSTAGSDIESVAARTLPRPQGLMGGGQVHSRPCHKDFSAPRFRTARRRSTSARSATSDSRAPARCRRTCTATLARSPSNARLKAVAVTSRSCPTFGDTARSTRATRGLRLALRTISPTKPRYPQPSPAISSLRGAQGPREELGTSFHISIS
ncbi:C2H2 finger domain-containing protein FlbC [Magnaporthiopsis poae ATCC 64411]|uniref:C2H2 finger domain-containing protein FlbC n=1 Tax=Magnaporthiopsis poae (strain ATCC 64411 / 73-15) TaxID=644358 RepID=A0A0C4E1W3_MAGP6|nr:C2H2 finger domain-containing protein FlbC [Magnaporthiopsis poae ATCC 64411]